MNEANVPLLIAWVRVAEVLEIGGYVLVVELVELVELSIETGSMKA